VLVAGSRRHIRLEHNQERRHSADQVAQYTITHHITWTMESTASRRIVSHILADILIRWWDEAVSRSSVPPGAGTLPGEGRRPGEGRNQRVVSKGV